MPRFPSFAYDNPPSPPPHQALERQLSGQAKQETALLQELSAQLKKEHRAELRARLKKQHMAYRQALKAKLDEVKAEYAEALKQVETAARNEKQLEIQQHLRVHESDYERRMAKELKRQEAEIRESSEATLLLRLGEERAKRVATLERLFLRLKTVEAVMVSHAERDEAVRRMQRVLMASQAFMSAVEDRDSLSQQVRLGDRGAEGRRGGGRREGGEECPCKEVVPTDRCAFGTPFRPVSLLLLNLALPLLPTSRW